MSTQEKYTLKPIDGGGFRIIATRRFRSSAFGYTVRIGDVGGKVPGPQTLSHKGSCWIDADSTIIGTVEVSGSAYIRNSRVSGDGVIKGETKIDKSQITAERIRISGASLVWGSVVSLRNFTVSHGQIQGLHILREGQSDSDFTATNGSLAGGA